MAQPSRRRWLAHILRLESARVAAGWYFVLTLVMTWPVAAGATRRLPNDLGDPLLVCWILSWELGHVLRFLQGHLAGLSGFWNANIFYPETLTLAYSEHLFALAVQALPLYAISRNIVLCYNALFLSTFFLSGLGVYLLVRELTGSARGAFVAGLFYAFLPYRLAQLGHLQVLSSQWMPFALFALRRFFVARREEHSAWSGVRPLLGAALSLLANALSCGYYLVYFAPFVVLYCLWELARTHLWRDFRTWAMLTTAAVLVGALTLPFLLPYLELRGRGFEARSVEELRFYSADVLSYVRGSDSLWLWPGGFSTVNRAEGHLFPGVTPPLLAGVALVASALTLRRRSVGFAPPLRGWRLALAVPVALVGVAALDLARFELLAGRRIWRVRLFWPWLSNVTHVFWIIGAAALVLVILSPRARAVLRLSLSSGRVFFAAAFAAAAWLSFGPHVTTGDHGISGETVYMWLYRYMPGFDGLRVPARFGMLAAMFLSVLAGYGAALLGADRGVPPAGDSRFRFARLRRVLLACLAIFFLLESTSGPLDTTKIQWRRRDGFPGVVTAEQLDRLYTFIRQLPKNTVVVEFPFGEVDEETRALYFSTIHGHPIVNGYGGTFPPAYVARLQLLNNPAAHGDPAWPALLASGATCVVVHEWAFDLGNGRALSEWLEAHGALPVATFKGDRVFEIRR